MGNVTKRTDAGSCGFFRALAFLYRERARILRARAPLTERQRELMAKLFDSLALNSEEISECLRRHPINASEESTTAAAVRRTRMNKAKGLGRA